MADEEKDKKLDNITQEKADFLALLQSESGCECFMQHLKQNYTEHHLMFWQECQKYRQIEDETLRKEEAKKIYGKFVKSGTRLQINVTDVIRGTVEDKVAEGEKTLFDAAERVCMDLMKGNQYHPFMKTKDYEAFKKSQETKKSSACTIL